MSDHPLAPANATPEIIRDYLFEDQLPEFDAQNEQMSDEAKVRQDWLESWRSIAVVQVDPEKFWAMAYRIARREWPEMPEDTPPRIVRRVAGL